MLNRVNWKYDWKGLSNFNTKFEQKISYFEGAFPELLAYKPPSSSLIQKDSNGFPIYNYKGNNYIYETEKLTLPNRRKYRSMSDFVNDMLNIVDLRIIQNWKDGQYDQFFLDKYCHSSPYSINKSGDQDNENSSCFADDSDDLDDIIDDILDNDECSENWFDGDDKWKQIGINDSVDPLKELSNSILPYNINTQQEDRKTCFVAFYSPFHFSGIQAGIYYSSYGIVKKSQFIFDLSIKQGWKYSKEECYIIAKIMTFYHEFFHHKIEAMATRIEVSLRRRFYIDGFSKHYSNNSSSGDKCYEETLANLYSYIETLDSLSPYFQKSKLHKIMFKWMKSQPRSYKNALRFVRVNKDDNTKQIKKLSNKFSELICNRFNKWEGLPVVRKPHDNWNVFTYSHSPFTWKETNINYLF
jgi:hypothetical protein